METSKVGSLIRQKALATISKALGAGTVYTKTTLQDALRGKIRTVGSRLAFGIFLPSLAYATTTYNLTIYVSGDKTYGDKIMTSLIADTTTQFDSRIIADGARNSYSVSLYSRRPEKPKGGAPAVYYVGTSTDAYANSWANGVEYGRWRDLEAIRQRQEASSVCSDVLEVLKEDIKKLGYQDPPLWKGVP